MTIEEMQQLIDFYFDSTLITEQTKYYLVNRLLSRI